ncbi:MAG: RimK/LysX family protein [Thermodesulfobacteriota bacterium]|nr:RimK/LysX family protein [Thermodesulfobacteriota bacterium]
MNEVLTFFDGVMVFSYSRIIILFCLIGLSSNVIHAADSESGAKVTVGWVERVYLPDYDFTMRGKIDTGAKNSSIHATDMEFVHVEEGLPQSRIRFTTVDTKGKSRTIEADIVRTVRIKKTIMGSETPVVEGRVEIELLLCMAGITKLVRINLTNREGMNYRLILGRTALEGDFVVDVSKTLIGGKTCRTASQATKPLPETIE